MQTAVSPCFVLAAYAEPLLEGRRVVVFGSATSGFDHALVQRGARLVHVYDNDVSRVAEATARATARNISYAPLAQAGVAVRDGAFDVAIVADLSSFDAGDELIKQVRRALSVRGVAVIASPNSEAQVRLTGDPAPEGILGYYEFYDAVAAEFEEVKMFGQAPFVGYAMAEFGLDREPDISIDSEFLPSGAEEPEWFVALASRHALTLEPFSVIQLPLAELARPEAARSESEARQSRKAEEEARAEALKLQEELARLKTQRKRVPEELKRELERLSSELAKRDAWTKELEARAATADQRADDVQGELDQERLAHKRAVEAARGADEAKQLRRQLDKLEAGAKEDSSALERAKAEASAAREELQAQEELLAERAKRIAELEHQLRHTERTGQQLLHELRAALDAQAERQSTPPTPTNGGADNQRLLEQQAERLAELEGDLEAARWTIQELEGKLS